VSLFNPYHFYLHLLIPLTPPSNDLPISSSKNTSRSNGVADLMPLHIAPFYHSLTISDKWTERAGSTNHSLFRLMMNVLQFNDHIHSSSQGFPIFE